MPDDAALLSRYATADDEAAFAEFVARHVDTIYSSALRRVGGDRHFAEDVTQQVFFAVAGNAARVATHPMITGWLFTTTRNIAGQLVRTEQRRKVREQELAHGEVTCSPDDPNWPSVARFLDEALDQLTALDRSAILLRFMQHRGYLEIGSELGLSEDAARMRVDRAMQKLRTLLARHGVKSSAAAIGVAMTAYGAGSAPPGFAATITAGAVTGAKVAGAASAWGSLSLVTGAKFTSIAVGLALISALTYGILSDARSRRIRHEAEGIVAERNQLLATQLKFEERARQAEARLLNLQSQMEVARTNDLSSSAADPGGARGTSSTLGPTTVQTKQISDALTKTIHTDPELLRLRIEDIRNRIRIRYGPLFSVLHLSSGEIEIFEQQVVRRAEAQFRLMLEKFQRGITEDSAEYLALKQRNESEIANSVDQSLRTLLGEAGYTKFQQYDRSNAARPIVDALAAAVHFTNEPLTASQSIEFARILIESSDKGVGMLDWTDVNWEQALSRAGATLSAKQLAALTNLRQQAEGRRRFVERREQLRSAIIDSFIDGSGTTSSPGK